jgi:type I restriction enzyme S subunit
MDVYSNDYIRSDLSFMAATATAAEVAKFKVDRGDVLITKDSETPDDIGIPAVVMDDIADLICGYHLALIKPNRKLVDPVFLSKQLSTTDTANYFYRYAAGSTRYGLSNGAVANTQISFPALQYQQKIATILTSIDTAIEKTEALIAKYQQIKAGLMHDLFTRGVRPNGQLRAPRDQAPELYQQTAMGWIPREWKARDLGTACDWYSGGTPSKRVEAWWEGTFPWLSPKDMKQFELSDTEDHVTREAANIGSRIVPTNSVFIVVRGMILAHSFPVVLSGSELSFNQDVKAVIGKLPLENRFLAYWMVANTNLFLRKTTEATHGTKRFDLRDLYEVIIGIPSKDEQKRIFRRLDTLVRRIDLEKAQLQKLQRQKLGLMQDLLTGKVPVKVHTAEKEFA